MVVMSMFIKLFVLRNGRILLWWLFVVEEDEEEEKVIMENIFFVEGGIEVKEE